MYKILLAFRYLFKRRISYFSVAAVALCVFVVLVVITVLSGLTGEFKTNTHQSVGDCVVTSKSLVGFGYYEEFVDILEEANFIEAVSPVIRNYAMVNVTAEYGIINKYVSETAEIIGIDSAKHSRVTAFAKWLHYHKREVANAFELSYDPNLIGCVPGVGFLFGRDSDGNYKIAKNFPRIKFELNCFPLTAKGAAAKAGAGEVNTKIFYYSDHTLSGLAKADSGLIYLPFDEAQRLCGMGMEPKRVSAIHIKFKPDVKLAQGCKRVADLWDKFLQSKADTRQMNLLKQVRVQSWKTYRRQFVAAVETEQTVMIIVFGMIGIITVFIVFVVFYMIVSHKSKDIGILKSVGVSKGNVLILFLSFSFLVAAFGSTIGAVGGWQFLVHINQIEDMLFKNFGFQLWDRTIYAIDDIPNAIDLKILAGIILSAITACLIGALIPSWQAARLKPIETLQVNQL